MRIVAAVRFPSFSEMPVVDLIYTLCQRDSDEADIADIFFEFLLDETFEAHAPTLVTWGGEALQVTSLRRVAQHRDLALPVQMRAIGPDAPHRLDLSQVLDNGSENIQISEYAHNLGLPALPKPGFEVSAIIERGDWKALEEQCAATVMTGSILTARHLATTMQIAQSGASATDEIVGRFC